MRETYGLLKVLKLAYVKGKHSYWKCICRCGRGKVIRQDSLASGRTTSCGCVRSQKARATINAVNAKEDRDGN